MTLGLLAPTVSPPNVLAPAACKGGLLATLKWLFVASILLRLLAMALVPLAPEEAYYWMYSQHPSLSYYDHPPMVAWMIGLGTAIFGNTEFGVRIVGNLLMIGASLLLYRFGAMWFGRRAGLLAAVLLQVLPIYYGAGFVATMDSALLFFWALSLVGVSMALQQSRPAGWYLAGIALGCALLSKYTGVLILSGAVLSVVAYRPWWRHLRTWHPYIALALAILLFSPVLIWNAQHDYASFRFQFFDRFSAQPVSIASVLTFILYQLLSMTPLLVWVCLAMTRRAARSRRALLSPRWLIGLSFALPLLGVMAYKSLRYDVHINWTLPLFVSLFPAASFYVLAMIRRERRLPMPRWTVSAFATVFICLVINVGLVGYLVALQPHMRLIAAFGPWRELSAIVEDCEDRLEAQTGREPLIVAEGKYRLASALAFYRSSIESDSSPSHFTTSQWLFGGRGLGFPYWNDGRDWIGEDCIYVVDGTSADLFKATQGIFESVQVVDDPRLKALAGGRYHIAICRNLMKRDGAVAVALAASPAR